MEIDSSAESVKYRSPPRKNSPRAVSATDSRHDQGQSNNGKEGEGIGEEGGGAWGGYHLFYYSYILEENNQHQLTLTLECLIIALLPLLVL